MSPAAPEATNRASTTPRSEGVARLVGRGGEVATATGRTPRLDADPKEASRWRATRQARVHTQRRDGRVAPWGCRVAPTTAARPRRSASPADPQAERMAGGVEGSGGV